MCEGGSALAAGSARRGRGEASVRQEERQGATSVRAPLASERQMQEPQKGTSGVVRMLDEREVGLRLRVRGGWAAGPCASTQWAERLVENDWAASADLVGGRSGEGAVSISLPLLPGAASTPLLVLMPPGALAALALGLPAYVLLCSVVMEVQPLVDGVAVAAPERWEAAPACTGRIPAAVGP